MCVVCQAAKSNEITLNEDGEILNLATGKVTRKDGTVENAPMLTEQIIDALAAEGLVAAEAWANKDVAQDDL